MAIMGAEIGMVRLYNEPQAELEIAASRPARRNTWRTTLAQPRRVIWRAGWQPNGKRR